MSRSPYELAVVGSGAAGLVAALAAARRGLRTVVLEKSSAFGGTSAMSGGLIYAPGSSLAEDAGQTPDPHETWAYLRALARAPIDEEILGGYLAAAPAMVDFLISEGVALRLSLIPDYYQDIEGAGAGKVVAAQPFAPDRLGELAGVVRRSPYRSVPDGEPWLQGMAVIGHLLAACVRAGVELLPNWRARDLVTRDAAVVGVDGVHADTVARIEAPAGVILASGGFEFNRPLVESAIDGHIEGAWSCPANEGDAIAMAASSGAQIGPADAQWYALLRLSDAVAEGAPRMADASPARNLPGSIVVNRQGRRFANEGEMFQDFGRTLSDKGASHLPAWLIVDQQFVDRYAAQAFGEVPMRGPHVAVAGSLTELAELIEVPPQALADTVRTFNGDAALGVDRQFGRGASGFDQSWGDSDRSGPAACLEPLAAAPFYATRVYAGCSGTTGGLVSDASWRVLDPSGTPIPGLYAVGNVTANPFGGAAPGSGSTLGPNMTAGYLAGRDAAARYAGFGGAVTE